MALIEIEIRKEKFKIHSLVTPWNGFYRNEKISMFKLIGELAETASLLFMNCPDGRR